MKEKSYNIINNIAKEILYFVCAFIFLIVMHGVIPFITDFILQIINYILNLFSSYSINIELAETNIATSLIGITFTIFGFALTMRNILISRDTSNYSGFSMKTIIENSSNFISNSVWYLILSIPFFSLIIYFLGFRRRLYLLVVLSGICVIIYLSTVLHKLTKQNCRRTIEYIIIDNLFDTTDIYKKEYRKEYFNQLICDSKINTEIQITFIELLNLLHEIISHNNKKNWLIRTVIHNNIRKKWESMTNKDKTNTMKVFSEYSYIYFSNIINNYQEEDYQNLLVEFNDIITDFIETNNINLETYITYLRGTAGVDNSQDNSDYINLVPTLYFNLIFGLLCACTCKMDLQYIKNITKLISQTAIDSDVLLSDTIINTLSLFAIYYAKENNLLSEKIPIKELYEFILELFSNTSYLDFDFFKSQIYEKFTVFDYSNYINRIYDCVYNEKKQFYMP